MERIKSLIRDVPDFPKPGILFKDITPLLADARGFRRTTELLCEQLSAHSVDAVVGIESRGFIFGAAVALQLSVPLQLVRKPGKLPYERISRSYDLEYGSDTIEMHVDAVDAGKSYAIVDDLIATGGTAQATAELIRAHSGKVACFSFVIELEALNGRDRLDGAPVHSVLTY